MPAAFSPQKWTERKGHWSNLERGLSSKVPFLNFITWNPGCLLAWGRAGWIWCQTGRSAPTSSCRGARTSGTPCYGLLVCCTSKMVNMALSLKFQAGVHMYLALYVLEVIDSVDGSRASVTCHTDPGSSSNVVGDLSGRSCHSFSLADFYWEEPACLSS